MFRKKIVSCIVVFVLLCFNCLGYSQESTSLSAPVIQEPASEVPDIAMVDPGNVTVNFKGADIGAVLNYLSEVSGVDIVPAPDVSGAVTLKLTNKSWEVALDIITKNYGYAYERDGNIIRVVTLDSLRLEELSTEVVYLNYSAAEDAQDAVKDMLTSRGKMTFDTRINALVITDLATNIYKIKRVVNDMDKKTPQIMIEAKIIETTLGNEEKLGIDWNIVIAARGAARPTTFPFLGSGGFQFIPGDIQSKYFPKPLPNTTSTVADAGGGSTSDTISEFPNEGSSPFPYMQMENFAYGTLDFSQFSAVLEYLKQRSNTDIISNPRITTLNNKQAKMFVGKVYNYISEVEQKEDTGGQERWVYSIEKEEIGIRLLVTPHINKNGDIEVEVKPEIKDVLGFQYVTQYFSLPIFSTREAETQVMIRDRDTIFIGGLIREKLIETDSKFPILGDLIGDFPIIGKLFKHTEVSKEKTELIFFLTVRVVKDSAELNRYAVKDLTEIRVPLDIPGLSDAKAEEILITEKGVMKMPRPEVTQKKQKPLFDFRKKKVIKTENETNIN